MERGHLSTEINLCQGGYNKVNDYVQGVTLKYMRGNQCTGG